MQEARRPRLPEPQANSDRRNWFSFTLRVSSPLPRSYPHFGFGSLSRPKSMLQSLRDLASWFLRSLDRELRGIDMHYVFAGLGFAALWILAEVVSALIHAYVLRSMSRCGSLRDLAPWSPRNRAN